MRKVLVIRLSSLGDVVLTASVFPVLKRAWPDSRVTLLTKEPLAEAVAGAPGLDERLLLKPGESLFSLIQRVRQERFDTVIDLHSNWRSRWVSLFSGAAQRVRYRKAVLARRLYVRWRWASDKLQEHTLDRYFQALRQLGLETPALTYEASEKIKNLLVIQTAFLGNAVLTLPFLNALREHYPGAAISVLCTPEVAEVFDHHPAVSELIRFDKRGSDKGLPALWRMARQLRARRFPMVFLPHRSFKSALIARLAGIPRRIGFSTSQGRWLLTDTVPFHWGTHDADRNLGLLKAVGGRQDTREFALQPEPASSERIAERFRSAGIIAGDSVLGINAGSIWPTKRWKPDGFAEVADRAVRELGMKVIFFGGPGDAAAVQSAVGAMREKALNWVGQTSLSEMIAAVARCSVFLTNDSGPMHIAVACRVPTVAIFGPTTRELGFFPYGPGHIVIEKDLACRPCGLHGAKKCPLGHFDCMKTIMANEVFAAVSRQLKPPLSVAGASA